MASLKTEKQELFAQGLANGLPQAQAARNAGFAGKGLSVTASRLAHDVNVISRVAELKLMVEQAKANAVTATFQAALAHVPERAAAFVAQAVRERQYRISIVQDALDRVMMLIGERAAAGRAMGDMAAPGATTGLLAHKQKMLGSGKSAVMVDEYVFDSAVLSELRELLKHGAIEAGEWQEEGRQLPPVGPDLSHMTTDQLFAEQRILRETEQRIEAIRAGKPDPLMIQAAGPVVEVAGFQSGDVVEGVVVDADRGFVTNSDRIVDSDGGTHGDAEPESDLAPR